jgi:hypothetical protein
MFANARADDWGVLNLLIIFVHSHVDPSVEQYYRPVIIRLDDKRKSVVYPPSGVEWGFVAGIESPEQVSEDVPRSSFAFGWSERPDRLCAAGVISWNETTSAGPGSQHNLLEYFA